MTRDEIVAAIDAVYAESAQNAAEADLAEAQLDVAVTSIAVRDQRIAELEQALAECEAGEPDPEPQPGATGIILPSGAELHVAPPVGPLEDLPGNGTSPYGLLLDTVAELDGQTYGHIHAHDHVKENVSAMRWSSQPGAHPVNPPLKLHDLLCERAANAANLNGTSEFNLRVGCTAVVDRFELREADWSSLWLGGRYNPLGGGGGCYGSALAHGRIVAKPSSSAAVYLEHDTILTSLRNLHVTHPTGVCFKVEWWYGSDANGNRVALAPSMHGSWDCSVRDSYFKSPASKYAISLDYGTSGFLFDNIVVERGSLGVELPNYLIDPESAQAGNPNRVARRSGLLAEARPDLDNVVTRAKWSDGTPLIEGDGITYHNRGAGS